MAAETTTRRLQILEAAGPLFAQTGFDGTSMGAVAEAAGEKKSLVQYHFGNKQQLWEETVTHLWQQRNDALPKFLEAIPEGMAPNDMMRSLCREILRFTFDNPIWVNIMCKESAVPGPRLDWMVDNFIRQDFADGEEMVKLAQSAGVLPKVDSLSMLYILSGALIYLVNIASIIERVSGEKANDDAFIERHIDSLLAILLPNAV